MTMIAMAGLPGTGKTTLANALIQAMISDAHKVAPIILNKDALRAALFPPGLIEYSTEQDDFCVDIILLVAKYLFRKAHHRIVILDGRTFSQRYQVDSVERAASDMGIKVYWIECVCDPETAKQRLTNDKNKGIHPAANRQPSLYDKVKACAEPLIVEHLSVDTTQPLQDCVAEVRWYLAAH